MEILKVGLVAEEKKSKKKVGKIPTGNLDKDFTLITEYAKSKILNREGIEPTLFIIDSKAKEMGLIAGGDLPYDGNVKEKIFKNIGADYAERMPNADCFIMMMEAWASANVEKDSIVPPHQDPNRVELFMVTAKKANGEEKIFSQAFRRDERGKVEFLDPAELKNLNQDWFKPGQDEGFHTENRLLTSLWRQFMMTKIFNQLENGNTNNTK